MDRLNKLFNTQENDPGMRKAQIENWLGIHTRKLEAQKRINATLQMKAETAQDGADNAFGAALALGKRLDRQEEHIRDVRQAEEVMNRRLREVRFDLEDVEDLRLMVYMSLAADAVLLFAVIYLLGK